MNLSGLWAAVVVQTITSRFFLVVHLSSFYRTCQTVRVPVKRSNCHRTSSRARGRRLARLPEAVADGRRGALGRRFRAFSPAACEGRRRRGRAPTSHRRTNSLHRHRGTERCLPSGAAGRSSGAESGRRPARLWAVREEGSGPADRGCEPRGHHEW